VHANLLFIIQNIKNQAEKRGAEIYVKRTTDNGSLVISNILTGKVALVGIIRLSGAWVTAAYSVDPVRWQEAEAAGYTKNQILNNSNLASEIFKELSIDKVANYLI